ncbi:unnamed protein product [Rhizophagus irregularis]|uniref:Uncharacterized protein n=1 Tax=Rhizophagus irregularis TaxID=588596 RepID=A0A916EBZ5_9GLOM|nr:unnamed protein product [Rhizophagus irregularis]
MRVAGRIGVIIVPAALEHPRCLEEAPVMVAAQDRLALFVEDHRIARRLGEALHIGIHAHDLAGQRRLIILVQIGIAAIGIEGAILPALELPAPDAAEIHVALAVLVSEHRRIHREAARNRLGLGLERAHRAL